jgi:hypothetical protein
MDGSRESCNGLPLAPIDLAPIRVVEAGSRWTL